MIKTIISFIVLAWILLVFHTLSVVSMLVIAGAIVLAVIFGCLLGASGSGAGFFGIGIHF